MAEVKTPQELQQAVGGSTAEKQPSSGIEDGIEDSAAVSPLLQYSAFSKAEKSLIAFLIAFAAMFSPLSSFIYYPAITSLSRDLHVSLELINLTITSYMVVSGVAPAILGDLADMTGRRLVYLFTLGVYCAADVGLALQNSWAALLVLRMLQSVGSSGKFGSWIRFRTEIGLANMVCWWKATISLAYGVIADIASPAERGSYVGGVLAG